MTQKELAAYCPGIDQLEQTLLETLISIEDPNARLNAFYNVLTKREEKVGDMEEEFENFFLSPKGFVEQFIHLLDSTPSSPDRDRLIVSLMDLILERSLAMVYEVGGEERAKLLLSKIESETWRERGQALLIEFREQYNWYEAGSRIRNNKQFEAMIQGIKNDYAGLRDQTLSSRQLAKLANMMAEGGNVRYAIKLAQRIKAPFHRFVALAEIAFTHYMETNNNPDKALLISLLDQAGALLPEIMEKHKGRYELASNQHTLIYLYNALDMCDKAIEELDRILILEDKISELSLFLNNLHHANKRSELQELIRRYCHFSQSLNIVDKAKWICALVQEIERYGKFVDSRQLVATLHDEINREEDVICRYNAMIHLGVCYLRINDGETAFTAFRSLEIENTTDITEDHRIRIFVDLLVALANERLVAAVVRALELSDDPRLLVHTFLKIPDRIENHYRDEIACNVPESRENYRKMLEKIHQAVASLENPLDRALALTCLIASNNEAR